MTSQETVVREQQCAWARSRGLCFDSAGYTERLSDNLFASLSAATQEELDRGDGAELGRAGERGKIQALHSSSALACNFFDYWRQRSSWPLAGALRLPGPISDFAFECKYPTGLSGTPPHLDVVLRLSTGRVVAIESKFLEPYTAHGEHSFRDAYFKAEPGLWQASGYPGCQNLAEALYSGKHVDRWLHARQLLKHILGLVRAGGEWTLLYLWYELPDPASSEHAKEAERFALVARSDGIDFRPLTYQNLFSDLKGFARKSDRAYMDYLGGRYFATSA
jgi:hypothetical protein